MLTDERIVNLVWHDKVEDHYPWSFCAKILEQNGTKISPETLRKKFFNYFQKTTGIKPYTKCPNCSRELLPRKSQYGYFVGCSRYPDCHFKATPSKPYKNPLDLTSNTKCTKKPSADQSSEG